MESYNQSSNELSSSQDPFTKEIPLFVTFVNMVIILIVVLVVITPAAVVINIIWCIRELHTKYYFFVANLLATNIVSIIVQGILQYLLMILYLFDMNSNLAGIALRRSVLLLVTILHLMTVMSPITLAAERMVVIGFPLRHRSIMTTKTVAVILAAMWGISTILTIIIIVIVPVDIIWPLALIDWDILYMPFIVTLRITSAVFIIAANVFLQYKVMISNRKARENDRLGNEQMKRLERLVKLLRAQAKATITLFVVGGIDVVANILIPTLYVVIGLSVDPLTKVYIEQFFLYPLRSSLLLSHPLVYGLYMSKIRKRLPLCTVCERKWKTRRSKVVTLHRQP